MSGESDRPTARSAGLLPEAAEVRNADEQGIDSTTSTDEGAVHLSAREASAGRKLGVMRYVLIISLIAIIAIFAALLLIYR